MQFLDEAYGAIRDTILNDATYLSDSESIIKVDHIPLIENTRLGEYLVEFKYLDRLSEEYDLNYENAMTVIAESNDIDASNVGVVIDDWKIIETPELLDIVPNPVLKPISEDSFAYKYVDTFMQAFAETLYILMPSLMKILRSTIIFVLSMSIMNIAVYRKKKAQSRIKILNLHKVVV